MFCVLLGPAGRTAMFFCGPFFFFFPSLEALPTCVIVWPLSACLPQRARLCSSPRHHHHHHPTPQPTARSTPPCGHLQTCFSSPAKSSSFRTGPPVFNFLLLLLRQRLSSTTSSVSFLQGSLYPETEMFDSFLFFSVALMDLPLCISFYVVCLFVVAKRVDVVVGDADDDCVLIIMIFMAFLIIGLYAVMSFSPAPLSGSEAAAEVLLLQRVLLSKATHAQNTSDLSNLAGLWRLCSSTPPPPAPPRCLIPNPLVFDMPHSHWCFMFNSGSTQLHLEPPQLTAAFHFYAKTGGLRSQPPTRSYI